MDKPLGVDVRKDEPEKPEPQPDTGDEAPEEMPEEGEGEGEDGKPQDGEDNAADPGT